ncbi:MAG: peptidoglycan editing factor PgeF [Pseudomonadota bacterium]
MTATALSISPLLSEHLQDVTHGFFTRKGGASSGVFGGLNCGFGSSDQAEIVAMNRARVAEYFGLAADRLVTVHQTHSADVLSLSEAPQGPRPKADAIVTATPGLAIAVLTADCQPVLFSDRKTGVVAAAHAGWRGALSGVLEATLHAMENLGAARADIQAVIGPSISQAAYEVGQEFLEEFMDDDPQNGRFFAQGAMQGKFQFDLPAYGLARLRAAGVGQAHWTRHCTYSDQAHFFSYRRSVHNGDADYGRLISAICL